MFTLVNINLLSPKLVCAFILWTSALGLLMGEFHPFWTELSARNTSVIYFQENNLSKSQRICALVCWRSTLGVLIGKFHEFLTELSAHDMIMGWGVLSFHISLHIYLGCWGSSLASRSTGYGALQINHFTPIFRSGLFWLLIWMSLLQSNFTDGFFTMTNSSSFLDSMKFFW